MLGISQTLEWHIQYSPARISPRMSVGEELAFVCLIEGNRPLSIYTHTHTYMHMHWLCGHMGEWMILVSLRHVHPSHIKASSIFIILIILTRGGRKLSGSSFARCLKKKKYPRQHEERGRRGRRMWCTNKEER